MITTTQTYLIPVTIDEALKFASQYKSNFKYLAGGTDVMANRFQGNENSGCLVDITNLDELKKVQIKGEHLYIGSLVKLSQLREFSAVKDEFPVLIEAADSVGTPLIRNSATIGGNLLCENRCIYYNQSEWWRESIGYCLKCDGETCIVTGTGKACFSEFISDTAPVLISMNANLQVADLEGDKKLKLEDIYTGNGISPLNLSKTAIIKFIMLPLNKGFRSVFRKLRQRESLEFTSLTSAVTADRDNNLTIALSGTDPKPIVIRGHVSSNLEALIKMAILKSRSVENDMLSRKFRKEMIRVFLTESFEHLMK